MPVTSEEDIFEVLGMEYKKPEDRNLWAAGIQTKYCRCI